uniref:NADH-ubiquinone oxidoreductase chain 1 n=1 Tax=Haptophyceae sp. NIES-3900 TaxID=2748608 RepID=A0A7R6WDR2_9EUKA|nr:NADH dehydrogenase subunit 1 [Haptophyceae sp. NIES-3900]
MLVSGWVYGLSVVIKFLVLVVPVLISVAYVTLAERKLMGSMQQRRGPNVVGLFGLLQPLADGLKLLVKETIVPSRSNAINFIIAPVLTLLLSLTAWAVIPFSNGVVVSDVDLGLMFVFCVSSLGVYGIVLSGWSSNSKYALLGALRSAAQMVSYEVSIGLILIAVLVCAGSLNLSRVVLAQQLVWFLVPLFPMFLMFLVSILAETNRAPFDLPEAEAELVSGYNVEYSAMGFALFFLGEYGNMIMMSGLTSIFFLGGWLSPINLVIFQLISPIWFALKINAILFFFIWVRATFPRYRYDQLMRLGWKIFLPLSFAWVLFVASILLGFGWLV